MTFRKDLKELYGVRQRGLCKAAQQLLRTCSAHARAHALVIKFPNAANEQATNVQTFQAPLKMTPIERFIGSSLAKFFRLVWFGGFACSHLFTQLQPQLRQVRTLPPFFPSHPRKKMKFSKLLCLVLVYSQLFGQVLLTPQITETCTGTAGSTVPCKRKTGEKVILTISTGATNTKWMKGTIKITNEADKRIISADVKTLTILKLAEGDEGEYTAGTTPEEKFQVQVVPVCAGSQSGKVTCKGKPGGELELKSDDGTGPYDWKKDNGPITEAADKYSGLKAKALTIMKLDDDDEGEYKGTNNDKGIVVQVADCFGGEAGSTVKCEGKLGKPLKLRISGSVTTSTVTWEKEGGTLPEGNVKKGTKNEGLILDTLEPADAGTYKATYDSKTVSFTVSFPDPKGAVGSTTTKKVATTRALGGGGGGGGLSYSPALLVTVTLVHLLLQLAA